MSSLPSTTSAKIKPWMIYACGAFGVGLLVGWTTSWLVHHTPTGNPDWPSYATLWGAFATFAVGLIAVAGAVSVGFGQLKIQQNQLQLSLLNRRLKLIDALRAINKSKSEDETLHHKNLMLIKDLLDESSLVFPQKIISAIEKFSLAAEGITQLTGEVHAANLKLEKISHDNEKYDTSDLRAKIDSSSNSIRTYYEVLNRITLDLLPILIAHARVNVDL